MAILCATDRIEIRDLPPEIRDATPQAQLTQLPGDWESFKTLKNHIRDATIAKLERRFLLEALQRSGGNVTQAAEGVGMQRTNFHALMRKYGLTSEVS
jgi:two-component system NtrC family response regulator